MIHCARFAPLALALLPQAGSPADSLRFAPEQGSTLTRTFEIERQMEGGDLEAIRADVTSFLLVAEALNEASTISAQVLAKLLDITADGKIDKKEAKAAAKLLTTATKNFKGLMKR